MATGSVVVAFGSDGWEFSDTLVVGTALKCDDCRCVAACVDGAIVHFLAKWVASAGKSEDGVCKLDFAAFEF